MAWTTTRHEPHRRDGQAARPHCGTAARTPHVRHGTVAGPPPGELHEDSKTDRGDKTPGSKCRQQDGAAGPGSAHRRGHRTGRPRRVARIPALARGRPPQPPPVRRAAADRAGKLFLQATSEEDTKPPGDPERPGQLARKRAGGLHRPPQRRHRITPRIRLSANSAGRSPGSATLRRPPPGRRTRPRGSSPASSSNTPLRTVVSLTAAACATARTPPCPRSRASAAISSRRCRSSSCGSNIANFTASW